MSIQADVYFRFPDHGRDFSIRSREGDDYGRVRAHATEIAVEHVNFTVQPAGREKVLDKQRKNVHAFVRGDVSVYRPSDQPRRVIDGQIGYEIDVRYNPYAAPFFFDRKTGQEIKSADAVKMYTVKGKDGRYHPVIKARNVFYGERFTDGTTLADNTPSRFAACSI